MPRPRLETILRTALVIASVPVFGVISFVPYRMYQSFENQELTQTYIEENADSIEEEVEDFFGIDIQGYNLEFNDEEQKGVRSVPMRYTYDTDTITVYTSEGSPFLERPEGWVFPVMSHATTKGIFIHELAHDYLHQVEDDLDDGLHPDYTPLRNLQITHLTVEEGIADYFAVSMGENQPIPKFRANPVNQNEVHENYLRKLHYEHGRRIVTPILDELGVERGIKAILTNPMITEDELLKPELYQQRILASAMES